MRNALKAGTRARRWMGLVAVTALTVQGLGGLGACSSTDPGAADGGSPDATTADGTTLDATRPDTGNPETSVPDTSVPDTAVPDAALPDTAVPDAALPDTSVPDTSVPDTAVPDAALPPMTLTSATLTDGGRFPAAHTCSGVNRSPALTWTAGPAGTLSYAIVMKDLTVPNIHWTLYDIPASTLSVGASVPVGYTPGAPAPAGSKQAGVTFSPGTLGYLGPCPPSGDHTYVFTVHAISNATLAGVAMSDTPEAIEAQILAQQVAGGSATLSSNYRKP